MIYVYLAEGFEELEALTPVDVLRRAGLDVALVSMEKDLSVKGAHGVGVVCDLLFKDSREEGVRAHILPGGMPGTLGLCRSQELLDRLGRAVAAHIWVCAICAAPMVLAKAGLLEGRRATIYPGMEKEVTGALPCQDTVCVDAPLITSRGPGTAFDFSFEILRRLAGEEKEKDVRGGMLLAD